MNYNYEPHRGFHHCSALIDRRFRDTAAAARIKGVNASLANQMLLLETLLENLLFPSIGLHKVFCASVVSGDFFRGLTMQLECPDR